MKKITSLIPTLSCLLALAVLSLLMGFDSLRDPTRPPGYLVTGANTADPLQLSAIFIYPHRRIAVIGNQSLTVGDKFGEYTITTITPNTVELVGPAGKLELLQLLPSVRQVKH
jgi:hypothetical protein